MDSDEVRLHASNNHRESLQNEFILLDKSELYNDTRIICQDGEFGTNSLVAALSFPQLYACPAFFSHQLNEKIVIFPDLSRAEALQQVEALLCTSEDLVKAEFVEELDVDDVLTDPYEEYRETDLNKAWLNEPYRSCFKDQEDSTTQCTRCNILLETTPENKVEVIVDHMKRTHPWMKLTARCQSLLMDKSGEWIREKKEPRKDIFRKCFTKNSETVNEAGMLERSFRCNMCHLKIKVQGQVTNILTNHLQRFHKGALREKKLYTKRSRSPDMSSWYQQSEDESQRVKYSCQECGHESYDSSSNKLINHMVMNHLEMFKQTCFPCQLPLEEEKEGLDTCSECGSRFHQKCAKPESADDDDWCPVCARLKDEHSPVSVLRDKSRSTVCPDCGKEIKDLNRHIKRFHLGELTEPPVQCDICKRQFKRKCNLNEHLKMVHQKIIRFHCKFCERGFYNRTQLKRHVKIMHMNLRVEGQVACPECGKEMLKSTLKKHLRTVHQGIKTDDRACCEECGKQFTQRGSLFIHMRKAHGTEPEVSKNKSNHSKVRFFVDPTLIGEVYPELKPS